MKTRCRVPNCALCEWTRTRKRRERRPLGPGVKVTLAHVVRQLKRAILVPELPEGTVLFGRPGQYQEIRVNPETLEPIL